MTVAHPSIVMPATRKIAATEDHCPWCDQAIPHEKYDEIHTRIEAKERERTVQVERDLRERVAAEKAQVQAQAKAEVDRVRADAATVLANATKEASAREAKARSDAAAALANATTEAAAREVKARAEGKAAAETATASKMAAAEKAKQAAELQVHQQRELLEKAKADAVNAEKSKAFNDRQKLEVQLQAVQRQLQQKTANEIGEGAEVDLFETLKAEFPDDRIKRVAKGSAGADIIHEVVLHGRVCGLIVYDSKDRQAWRNDYVTKLRKDQLAAKADHSVVSTAVFPSGKHQVCQQDGVIIANPARVIAVVQILRKHILQNDSLRLSNEARTEKTARLYELITSDRFTQLLDELETLTADLLELDVKEHKAHEATWNRRGLLLKTVQKARGTIASEIEQIIGTASTDGQR